MILPHYQNRLNDTYTVNYAPIAIRQFEVFSNMINEVPIVNSTNNTNFVTGILWDYGDGGVEYNGTQDIVFITEINKGKQGYNGTVDFEIKIPAALRIYQTANTQTVAFYSEIK